MKTSKILIVLLAVFLVLLMGCSNDNTIRGNKIVVEKQNIKTSKYENFNEIKDSVKVKKVKSIISSANWQNANVSMVHPPEYEFYFEDTSKKYKSKGVSCDLWISPNKDKVELVIESENKYVQLSKEKSAELFEILTNEKLGGD